MGLRERFGCFFLAVGSVTFLLFVLPIAQAFRENPQAVPLDWIGIAFLALLILATGWRLYRSARSPASNQKPPSRGTRIASRWETEERRDED